MKKLQNPEFKFDDKCPDLAKHLILKMCQYDPLYRYSAGQALQHPFITRTGNEIPPMFLEEMQTFEDELKLKKFLLAYFFFGQITKKLNVFERGFRKKDKVPRSEQSRSKCYKLKLREINSE